MTLQADLNCLPFLGHEKWEASRYLGRPRFGARFNPGKAGLTFLTTTTGIWSPMNAIDTNAGGWEKSELRQKMNSGKIWNLMPSDFQSKVKAVKKLSNNVGGGDENKNAAVTATSDKLFLLSYSEIAPHLLLGILSLDFLRGHPVRGLQRQGDGEL